MVLKILHCHYSSSITTSGFLTWFFCHYIQDFSLYFLHHYIWFKMVFYIWVPSLQFLYHYIQDPVIASNSYITTPRILSLQFLAKSRILSLQFLHQYIQDPVIIILKSLHPGSFITILTSLHPGSCHYNSYIANSRILSLQFLYIWVLVILALRPLHWVLVWFWHHYIWVLFKIFIQSDICHSVRFKFYFSKLGETKAWFLKTAMCNLHVFVLD